MANNPMTPNRIQEIKDRCEKISKIAIKYSDDYNGSINKETVVKILNDVCKVRHPLISNYDLIDALAEIERLKREVNKKEQEWHTWDGVPDTPFVPPYPEVWEVR